MVYFSYPTIYLYIFLIFRVCSLSHTPYVMASTHWLVPVSRAILVAALVPPMVVSAFFNLYAQLFFMFVVVAARYVRDRMMVSPRAPAVWEDAWSDKVVQAVAKVIVAPLRALYIVDRYIFQKNPDVYWYYGVPLSRKQGFFDYLDMVKICRHESLPIKFVDHTEVGGTASDGDEPIIDVMSPNPSRRNRVLSLFSRKSLEVHFEEEDDVMSI